MKEAKRGLHLLNARAWPHFHNHNTSDADTMRCSLLLIAYLCLFQLAVPLAAEVYKSPSSNMLRHDGVYRAKRQTTLVGHANRDVYDYVVFGEDGVAYFVEGDWDPVSGYYLVQPVGNTGAFGMRRVSLDDQPADIAKWLAAHGENGPRSGRYTVGDNQIRFTIVHPGSMFESGYEVRHVGRPSGKDVEVTMTWWIDGRKTPRKAETRLYEFVAVEGIEEASAGQSREEKPLDDSNAEKKEPAGNVVSNMEDADNQEPGEHATNADTPPVADSDSAAVDDQTILQLVRELRRVEMSEKFLMLRNANEAAAFGGMQQDWETTELWKQPQGVNQLLRELASRHYGTIAECATASAALEAALEEVGPRAAPAFALHGDLGRVRRLGAAAVPYLRAAAANAGSPARIESYLALKEIFPNVTNIPMSTGDLLAALNQLKGTQRELLVKELGRSADRHDDIIAALIKQPIDYEPEVAAALARLPHNADSLEWLKDRFESAISDAGEARRLIAVTEALVQFAGEDEETIDLLSKHLGLDPAGELARDAQRSPRQMLLDRHVYGRAEASTKAMTLSKVREQIANGLGEAGPAAESSIPDLFNMLTQATDNNKDVPGVLKRNGRLPIERIAASRALGKIGPKARVSLERARFRGLSEAELGLDLLPKRSDPELDPKDLAPVTDGEPESAEAMAKQASTSVPDPLPVHSLEDIITRARLARTQRRMGIRLRLGFLHSLFDGISRHEHIEIEIESVRDDELCVNQAGARYRIEFPDSYSSVQFDDAGNMTTVEVNNSFENASPSHPLMMRLRLQSKAEDGKTVTETCTVPVTEVQLVGEVVPEAENAVERLVYGDVEIHRTTVRPGDRAAIAQISSYQGGFSGHYIEVRRLDSSISARWPIPKLVSGPDDIRLHVQTPVKADDGLARCRFRIFGKRRSGGDWKQKDGAFSFDPRTGQPSSDKYDYETMKWTEEVAEPVTEETHPADHTTNVSETQHQTDTERALPKPDAMKRGEEHRVRGLVDLPGGDDSSNTMVEAEKESSDLQEDVDAILAAICKRITLGLSEYTLESEVYASRSCDWQEAAEHGDPRALFLVAYCKRAGLDGKSDPKGAAAWFRKSAEKGFAPAQVQYGYCLMSGSGVGKDEREAAVWYRKGAEQGDVIGQHLLGICYKNGIGVAKDNAIAVEWFRKGARSGHSKAMDSLGLCYLQGAGVSVDAKEGLRWYTKAAELGDPQSQYNVGYCYRDGVGTRQNAREAYRWFRISADRGEPMSQYNVGVCMYNGSGVSRNREEGARWLRRAADHGCKEAREALQMIDVR